MSGFANAFVSAVATGMRGQAQLHGDKLQRRAQKIRESNELAVLLLAQFDRQAHERAARAEAAQAAGDHAQAVRLAESAAMAARNWQKIRDAIDGR